MSSAGISFGGLASGLDTKAIISALVAVEQRPITALQTKKSGFSQQKSLFGDLDGLLGKLTTAATALKTSTSLLAYKATSNDDTTVTATASSSAQPGTHNFRVLQLAQAQVTTSVGQASANTAVGTGTSSLMIQSNGNTYAVSVGQNPTVQSIADAINSENSAHDIGVTAEVIDTGSGTNRYQLVLRSSEVGSTGAFSVSVDEGDANFTSFVNGLTDVVPGQDAKVLLTGAQGGSSGITITRSSNTISDLWQGVTLNLQSANPTKDITVTVGTDTEETAKKMQSFVDAYNAVVDFVGNQNALDANGKAKNPLFGDSTLLSIRSSLRSAVGSVVTDSGNQAYQMLSQVGISSDRAGKLTFDRTKFDAAVTADPSAVTKLFSNATTGIANRLLTQVKTYDDTDGIIASRTSSIDRLVRDTQSRIDTANERLARYQLQLQTQYANLESQLTKLQSQGSSLSSIK